MSAAVDYSLDSMRASLAGAPLEWLVCDREAFALTTATPLQIAITRAIEGRALGKLGRDPDVLEAFGGALPHVGKAPREVVFLSGIRSAKSLIAAALSTRWSQCCDMTKTRISDMPRVNVVSLDKDKARVVLEDHLRGTMTSGRLISALYVDKGPDSISLRHPSGRVIETQVVAGKRAGGSLVSRWSAGTIFDEATRMVGDDDGVINLDDSRAAVLGRMLDNTQVVYAGSPHAPYGPVYDLYSKHFGNPTERILVIKARGPLMNPFHFTEELCENLRQADADAYRTDVLGEFLTPEEALFSHLVLEQCTRKGERDIGPQDGVVYTAAMDPGTRGNAWTLCISGFVDGMRRIVLARQWVGSPSAPLSPASVLHEIAGICHRYRIRSAWTDQHSFDALRDLASLSGLALSQCTWTETEKAQKYLAARALFVEGEAELPPEPVLLADLRRVKRKAVPSGVRIVLPETGDGRHCDYAPAVVMALTFTAPEKAVEKKEPPEVIRMRKEAEKRWGRPKP